jgi:pullulanase/glycogen debranching enzyme
MKIFPLTKEQQEVYQWLKTQELNTDDATLNYWVRTYKVNRIKDVVYFAHKRIGEGQKIRNIGGWVHKLLKTGSAVVNDNCKSNWQLATSFSQEKNWKDLMIYEKYIRDQVTDSDLPLTLPKDEFQKALIALYERSILYKEL